jgi:acetylornithine deacetylase/succinyl-diaminopimelate desuccinylase-like protein
LRAELSTLPADWHNLSITFTEQYAGHSTPSADPFGRIAAEIVEESGPIANASPEVPALHGFNSGCEAGLRAQLRQTPTLVWGPGSLAQAHAVDEFIDFSEVQRTAAMFVKFMTRWSAIGG